MIGGLLKSVFSKGWFSITPAYWLPAISLFTFLLLFQRRLSYVKVDLWQRPFYMLFRILTCSTSHFLREKALGTRLPCASRRCLKFARHSLHVFLFKSLFQRLVFTSDGVRVVIRTVKLCNQVKTAFWLRLRLLRLRSSENYNRFS